jgi:DNA-directed RNA polymerase specialized sigma24 family protein
VDCLGRESEDHRDLIIAVKLEGKSYAEIAEEKGISVDAVRMRVKRAVLALTRVFTDMGRNRL